MPVINVTDEAHAEAKARAAELGVSLAQYASSKLTDAPAPSGHHPWLDELLAPLTELAQKRSETPLETLEAAMAALVAPATAVVPRSKETHLWTDGQPACGCDGPDGPGSHHKQGCHRR